MKALVATHYGPPAELRVIDLPIPAPGPGQILVQIKAASINATDLRVVTGFYRDALNLEFPYVPGNDFAGTVVEVGPEVTAFVAGDEIFGQAMHRQLRIVASAQRPSVSTGTLAEYAVFEADTALLAHRPASVSPEDAAALAIGGMAARSAMKLADVRPGERVLVIGATGGVGTALVPLLHSAGAVITATADGGTGEAVLRELGADHVIGISPHTYPESVDAVFNLALFAAHLAPAAHALRPGGRLVSTVIPGPDLEDLGRDDLEVHVVNDLEGKFGGMIDVAETAAAGVFRATIGARYSLDRAVEAMVRFEGSGLIGKIVVTP
ncbi:NADP-dependent oxidoreductase [Rhodococcus sp. (in: high G+C Gram-positive bacteria)]|uniref:NADP-dependent oxidoreductase n=1 Tax=Rhodococcus sp. TaxID=1831 RepID=UPI003890660D